MVVDEETNMDNVNKTKINMANPIQVLETKARETKTATIIWQ